MSAATKSRKLLVVSLREGVVRPDGPSRVDRDKGVIYGVKILGPESSNGRKYTLEAIKAACKGKLYEGAPCNVDHPIKPTESRSAVDRLGKFQNVVEKDGCLYADLHYLKSHPLAERLCEAAERMPEILGFSHNANGDGWDEDGIYVVEAITEVRSVDLVADPATTDGIFEGRKPMKTVKKRAMLEAALKALERPAKVKKLVKRVLEMDEIPADAEIEAPADDADAEDKLKAGFKDAVMQLVDDALDGDGEALKKIADLIKSHAKINPASSTEEEAPEEPEEDEEETTEEEDEEKEDDEEDKMESRRLKSKLAKLERKDKVRDLCEEAGITPDKVLLEALMSVKDESAVKRLIEREKGRGQSSNGRRSGPRSTPAGSGGKSVPESKIPDKAEDWAKSLIE